MADATPNVARINVNGTDAPTNPASTTKKEAAVAAGATYANP